MHTKTALKLFAVTALSLFWFGCEREDGTEEHRSAASRLDDTTAASTVDPFSAPVAHTYPGTLLDTFRQTDVTALPAEIDFEPANGTVFGGLTFTGVTKVDFTGFTLEGGQEVEVQVLNNPDVPVAESNWVTVATGASDTTPTTFNDPAPIFRYSITAQPGANQRWEQGGILRYRTIVTDASGKTSLLPFYDTASGDCVAQQGGKSWKDVLQACKSPFSPSFGDALGSTTRAAAILSSSPEPGDGPIPGNYLSRRGFIFPSETDDYYDIIGAPLSLDEFAVRFGFVDDGDHFFGDSFDQHQVLSAKYYNLGDLGLGREIHCKQFDADDGRVGTACITENYGVDANNKPDFSGDADSAMLDNIGNQNSFAAVCMVKLGSTFADPKGNDVQFMVYGADGSIVDQAQLDSIGSNEAIPNNCLNCHGGVYDPASGTLSGSTFLPFDPQSFLYSKLPGFTYRDQADTFRQLNEMIAGTGAPPATKQYVDGTYGKSDDQGQKTDQSANMDWIPDGWSGSDEAKTVYREVYKPYCRTCHTSQVGTYSFITYDDFKQAAAQTMQDTCVQSQMPVCEATMGLFWRSSARAYLVNSLDASSSCTPGTFSF